MQGEKKMFLFVCAWERGTESSGCMVGAKG